MLWPWLLAAAGSVVAIVATLADPGASAAAAAQTWPAFVLVVGLLLVGLVAAGDGLFSAAGAWLAGRLPGGLALFAGVATLVVAVTAVLNLDTSVAFLTPVVVHTARRRGADGGALISACLLLSNAGSLLLPGSNLTNLIVLGSLHLSGGQFLARMVGPSVVASLVTAAVVVALSGPALRRRVEMVAPVERPTTGLGLAAVAAAVVAVVVLKNPAPEVFAVGVVAATARIAQRRLTARQAGGAVGLPVLVGLFGLAVGLGSLGRAWAFPSNLLRHLDPLGTAAVAAVSTVIVNNLPAASLFSARPPVHPLSLLIGLDVGPNLFVTGSLAWVLWYGAARTSGGRPDVRRTVLLGLVSTPLAVLAAVGALVSAGSLR